MRDLRQGSSALAETATPAGGYGEGVENRVLFARWHEQRDARAREELVNRFLPLARKLARRYVGAHEPIEDLVQVASLGLLNAIDRFDPSRQTAFSSFAVPTILGELKRHFRDRGWSTHVPRGQQELALKVQAAERELASSNGRSPSVNQIAEFLEIGSEEVLEAIEVAAAHHASSLDVTVDDGDGQRTPLAERIGDDDDGYDLIDASLTISAATRRLPYIERRVLALRFGSEMTQREIADTLGVSQMQISRVLRRAVSRLSELSGIEMDAPDRARRRSR